LDLPLPIALSDQSLVMNSKPIPKHVFIRVWAGLLALLALTWGLAQLDLGRLNAIAALTIAVVKMLLVLLYFMHLRFSARLTWIFAAAGFIWLLIMVDLTLSDYLTRGQVPGNPLDSWRHGTWPAAPEE
jgi:cytochrome c oxidase subunit 4